jgi:hypothetical protein
MSNVKLPESAEWGHSSQSVMPLELINRLKQQTECAIQDYSVLPEGPTDCDDRAGHRRVSVIIPLPETLFDQLMNGATGYRAHYSISVDCGEGFNRCLIEAIAPLLVSAEHFYKDLFDSALCQRSLLGPFSKFWYTKDLTDPSAQDQLLKYQEELRVPRWVAYWRSFEKPRKGLLAPIPDSPAVLLNGTFLNDAGEFFDQKPDRSQQLYDRGWT